MITPAAARPSGRQRWRDLLSHTRISQRIYLLVALGGLLFLSIGAIHLTGDALQERSSAEAQRFSEIARRVDEFRTHTLAMELSERTFSTLGDLQAHSAFVIASRRAFKALNDLGSMDETLAIRNDLNLLRTILREATALFARLHSLSTDIGLTPDDGLRGGLRTILSDLRQQLAAQLHAPDIAARMEQVLRFELAYQLHGRDEDLGGLDTAIGALERALSDGPVDPSPPDPTVSTLDAYREKLEHYASATMRRRNVIQIMLTNLADIDPVIERIVAFADRGRRDAVLRLGRAREQVNTLVSIGGGLSLLIFVLLALPVARSIARPITDISSSMRRLADGEQGVVVPGVDRQDEIADMARAITFFVGVIDRRETALRESEKRFRDFAETSADCFWETDPALRIGYVSNPGFVRDTVLPRSLESMPGVDPVWLRGRRPFRDVEFTVPAQSPPDGGNSRHFLVNGKPIHDSTGRFAGYRGSVMEHTDRKLAEKQMEAAKLAAEQALADLTDLQESLIEAEKMASLGQLVAGIAHEINTPVGVGLTAASHLEQILDGFRKLAAAGRMRRADLNTFMAQVGEAGSLLVSNLNRAAGLIQSFKLVAVDQASSEKRGFDLKTYLDEIVLSLKPELKRSRHQITIECPDGLMMFSFPGPLSQVLTNFIMNSVIHAYEDGDAGWMHIAVTPDDAADRVTIRYGDDGKGIPEENLSRVFEPFYTTRRGRGGSGLGLHATYNCVTQALRGRLSVASVVGEGTTFTMVLPRDLAD